MDKFQATSRIEKIYLGNHVCYCGVVSGDERGGVPPDTKCEINWSVLEIVAPVNGKSADGIKIRAKLLLLN